MAGSIPIPTARRPRWYSFVCALIGLVLATTNLAADGRGTIQFTKRFGGESVVVEVDWVYDRSVPSLTFENRRVIWTGDPVTDGGDGSDGCSTLHPGT